MRRLSGVIIGLLLVAATGGTAMGESVPKANGPELTVTRFYGWYMHALNQHIYPLDSKRDEIERYVTKRLVLAIDQMPKGPEGLDGDYFVDAQEWDPAWEKNLEVVKSVAQRGKAMIDLVLTGPQNPDHKLRVTLVNDQDVWKIDKVESGL